MFPGFFIGTMFLFLLVRTVLGGHRLRGHRFHGWYGPGWAHGPRASIWGDSDDGDVGWGRRGGRGFDASSTRPAPRARDSVRDAIRRFVGALRMSLRATPAQETVFEGALLRLRDATEDLRRGMDEAQRDLAHALRGDAFDDRAFDAASRRMDEVLENLRAHVRAALIDVHEVLDDRQRAALADLLEAKGSGF
jgi:hypothetical protein